MSLLKGLLDNVYLKTYRQLSGEESERYLKFLMTSRVSKLAFLSAYKELPPISEMPEKQKKEMKLYIHELFPGQPVEFKLDACKILYSIGTLL